MAGFFGFARATEAPERPPTEQMHMQMKDLLAAVFVAVHNQAIAAFVDALFFCDFRRRRR